MKWPAMLLWTVGVFASGWFAALWYASGPDTAVAVSPQEALAKASPSAPPAAHPEAVLYRAPRARDAAAGVGATDAVATRADAPTTAPLDKVTMDALLKMMEQSRLNETIDFQAQIRSEPWATESEAKIHAAVDPQLSVVAGARLLRADCRTTMCQAEIVVPNWATELTEMRDGPSKLHAALSGAGLRVVTISSSDATEPETKRLLFTMRPEDAPPQAPLANGH